jgi:outer membrane lipoprotein carrier protein
VADGSAFARRDVGGTYGLSRRLASRKGVKRRRVLCVSRIIMFIDFFISHFLAAVPAPVVVVPVANPVVVVVAQPVPKAPEVIKNVQAFYAKIKQVTAKFRQEVVNATFNTSKTSDGKVWIQKPGKMRWDYYSKPKKGKVSTKKSFISNGKMLYVVEHDNKQVSMKDLSQDLLPVAVSFLYGKGDLAADFDGKIDTTNTYGAKGDIVLELTPKKPSAQYKKLFLVVDPGNNRVKQSIIIDSADNKNHFRFYEPDFEKAVEAAWFEFDPKKLPSYRVVNLNTAGQGSGSAAGSGGATK